MKTGPFTARLRVGYGSEQVCGSCRLRPAALLGMECGSFALSKMPHCSHRKHRLSCGASARKVHLEFKTRVKAAASKTRTPRTTSENPLNARLTARGLRSGSMEQRDARQKLESWLHNCLKGSRRYEEQATQFGARWGWPEPSRELSLHCIEKKMTGSSGFTRGKGHQLATVGDSTFMKF